MALFSIIIPVYNAQHYLDECFQSILKQNFKDLEIILVDDCSADRSGEMCDFFAGKHGFAKAIHHKENRGVSAARNSGVNAARGEYVIFLDSDDCLFDGCLNGMAKLIEEKPGADVIIGRHNRSADGHIFEGIAGNAENPDGVIAHINSLDYFIGFCWRYVINRGFIAKNNLYFIDAKNREDEEYVARLLCLSRKFAFYNGHFYWHRARAASLSCSTDYASSVSCLKIASEMCGFIRNNDLSSPKKEYVYSRIKFIFQYFYPLLFMRGREEIRGLSEVIEKNMDNFRILEGLLNELDIYFFIKTYGARQGLLLYKEFIAEQTASLIEGESFKELYIFCAGLFAQATALILRGKGYRIKGFLDNNKALAGGVSMGLKISSPSILSRKSKDELSEVLVIVCSQRASRFEEISKQLKEIGLKEKQVAFKAFEGSYLQSCRDMGARGVVNV